MMQSLRLKLAVINVLPVLLLIPLLSLYLFYALEAFFSRSLLDQLAVQARLLSDRAQQSQELAENDRVAQTFLGEVARLTDAHVLLISREGVILASTDAGDAARIGTHDLDPTVAQALRGNSAQGIGPGFTSEVAYVVWPLQRAGIPTGALRLSYEVDDLRSEFKQLQRLVLIGVVLAIILGLGLGLGLATTIARPLRQLSESAQSIAAGDYRARVAVRSRDEIGALARSFNQMAGRLEEAEQTRQRQLAAIAHELARPLAGMRAAIETLHDGADADTEIREVLFGGVEEEMARLERLIGMLQGLHKRTLHPARLNRAEVALERLIRACIANFEPMAAQSGVALAVEITDRLPTISADEDRLIQVLTNLLDNALKFTPRGGRVTVRAGENTDRVWISVADTGVGIADDELPYIFQQFYRGDESRAPEKRGMGLGLAITREIITAHEGQIEVETEPGGGTRFTFTLPKS